MLMSGSILIQEKFRGPPKSGNGGYVSGLVAAALTDGIHNLTHQRAVEVTLRAPTPLAQLLTVRRTGEMLTVHDSATLIAEATIGNLQIDVPVPATWAEAMAVRAQSYSFPIGINTLFATPLRGVHPICFCCGAELLPTEGTHVYSAPFEPKHQVAAAWIPNEALADEHGWVRPEFIWTALDCPGQMAWRAEGVQTGMLGRLTARIEKFVRAGERCVVIGWTMGHDGRKYFAGTALFNEANELCALAKAVWIGIVN
jgi:hypothetical protein